MEEGLRMMVACQGNRMDLHLDHAESLESDEARAHLK